MADDDDWWSYLPCSLVVEVFRYLSLTERLHASSTCSKWRSCLFHPTLWRNIPFQIDVGSVQQTRFLMRFLNFVKEVTVHIPERPKAAADTLSVLNNLKDNYNLEKFCLIAFDCHLEDNIAERFVESVGKILLNGRRLKHISLGYIYDLWNYSLLEELAQTCGNSLKALHLSSLLPPEECEPPIIPSPAGPVRHALTKFTQLQVLSLNYDDLSVDLLLELTSCGSRRPLHKLLLLVDGCLAGGRHAQVPEAAWARVASRNPRLQVTLTFLDAPLDHMLEIMRPSMPLVSFRCFHCGPIPRAGFECLAAYNRDSLRSIHLHDLVQRSAGSGGEEHDQYLLFPDLDPEGGDDEGEEGEDPLVMMAWRCVALQHISIIGYQIPDDHLIAIARLRAPHLTLEVLGDHVIQAATGQVGITPATVQLVAAGLGCSCWTPLQAAQLEQPTFKSLLKSDLLVDGGE